MVFGEFIGSVHGGVWLGLSCGLRGWFLPQKAACLVLLGVMFIAFNMLYYQFIRREKLASVKEPKAGWLSCPRLEAT